MDCSFVIFGILFLMKCSIEMIDARSVLISHNRGLDVKYFESELDGNIGYWSPSTSSIDWCERNYVITKYIAEFWNCLSSFSMCLLGGILFVQGFYYKIERRFLLSSIGLTIIGLGSAYFHGTLTHLGQMADELPMVYSMIIWWFILFQMNKFKAIENNKFSIEISIGFSIFYGLLWTYAHSLKSFVLIFQGHMSLMVIGGIIKLIYLYEQPHHHVKQLKVLLIIYISLLISAFVCWIIDQQFCEQLNRLGQLNPQFHAWWHVLGAIHCHLGIVCSESMRLLSIKYNQYQQTNRLSSTESFKPDDHLNLVFYFGLPYVDYSKEKQIKQNKTQ